jgi:hypothetical protein
MRVCAEELFVNADETVKEVLLIISLIVLIWLFTEILVPIVMILEVFATLNLVEVPVTVIEPLVVATVPEITKFFCEETSMLKSTFLSIGYSA